MNRRTVAENAASIRLWAALICNKNAPEVTGAFKMGCNVDDLRGTPIIAQIFGECNMDTSGLEYTTWHDQRPSYRRKPEWLIELSQRSARIWDEYIALTDAFCDGRATHQEIKDKLAEANRAQEYYRQAWEAWDSNLPGTILDKIYDDNEMAVAEMPY